MTVSMDDSIDLDQYDSENCDAEEVEEIEF